MVKVYRRSANNMSNSADPQECRKEAHGLEILLLDTTKGITAVMELFANQLIDSVNATFVEPQGHMAVSY